MRACQNGNVVVTQVLVAAKANVDVQRAVSSSLVLMTFASMKYGVLPSTRMGAQL
jgi:hypothetical protein